MNNNNLDKLSLEDKRALLAQILQNSKKENNLEAMAQAGIYIAGETELSLVRIEDISLQRPIVVNPISGVKIEIYAEVMELNTNGEIEIKTAIRTEQTGFKIDHFSATLVLGKSTVGNHIQWNLGEALDIQPEKDLYGDLLFQGKRFQRMGNIFSLNHKESVFRSFILPEKDLLAISFAKNLGNKMVLGDPYFRDVLLQSVQLTIPQHICLPVHIDKIEFYQNFSQDKTLRIVSVVLQKRKDQEYIGEVVTTDDQGNVIEKLIGYKLRILEEHPENPTAEMLANPESEDRRKFHQVANTTFEAFGLNKPALAIGYIPCLSQKSREQRHLLEKPIINLALKDKLDLFTKELIDFSFSSLPSGKPQISGSNVAGLDLSLSHCDRYCLCAVDSKPQGCDLESITHREIDDWIALLSGQHESLLKELISEGDTQDEAGTRIWSSLEAVRKAFNEISKPQFHFVAKKGKGVLLKIETSNGNYGVITFPLKLIRPPQKMVAILVSLDKSSVLQMDNLKSSMASLINC